VVTAALYDARTGHTWVLNPRSVQYTASIVKVEIMGTALQEAAAAGQQLPESEAALMRPMIENSDNDAATALLSDVGGPSAVARFDRSVGMRHTTPSTLAFIPGTSLPGWGLTTTTALDEVSLVSDFAYPNPVLDGASRRYGLSLMKHVESDQSWGVSAGVGAGATVALKNGWLPVQTAKWQVDSIGWISGHGRNYVLAVLTAGSPTEEYGISTIEALARDVYRAQRDPARQ
jgi:beta-lactamase class A